MLSPKDFQELYMSVYEGMDPEERALKRELAADKRASKMDAKVGAKYAGSEARSAARADKKSKGKYIHGTVDEAKDDSYLEADMKKRQKNNEKAIADMKKTKAHADMVKAARKHFEGKEELEMQLRAHLRERALDAAEKREKESVFKALKPSKLAKTYPEKSAKEIKSLRYAISTSQAKKNMDTSRSDKRYGVER